MSQLRRPSADSDDTEVIDLRDPWRIEIAHPGTQQYEQAVALEASTFDHWFRNSPDELADWFAPYDGQMEVLTVSTPDGSVAGATRHCWSLPGHPSLVFHEMQREPFAIDASKLVAAVGGHEKFLDVLTVSADPNVGSDLPMVSIGFMGAIGRQARRRQLSWVISLLDDAVRDYFKEIFNIPLRAVEGSPSHEYMGSPATSPCEAGIEESLRSGAGIAGPAAVELSRGDPAKVGFVVSDELLAPLPHDWRTVQVQHAGIG